MLSSRLTPSEGSVALPWGDVLHVAAALGLQADAFFTFKRVRP
jgi:hypothetical protein